MTSTEAQMINDAPALPRKRGDRHSKNYPLGGIKTGPAWRAVWRALGDSPCPVWQEHLVQIGAAAGDANPATVRTMLARFRDAGIIRADKRLIGIRWQLVFWRPDVHNWRVSSGHPIADMEWLGDWCDNSGNERLQALALKWHPEVSKGE